MKKNRYDFLVIGAGLFGIYASIDLIKKGYKVILIDKEEYPYKKASLINQARIHRGYHYPRSVTTAISSNKFSERFIKEHRDLVNNKFSHYYGIDKYGSLTNASEFNRFAEFIGLDFEEVKICKPFLGRRLERLFKVQEYTFDPILLREFYLNKLDNSKVETKYSTQIEKVAKSRDNWEITLVDKKGNNLNIKVQNVVNSTYASINEINKVFKIKNLNFINQISEILFIYSKELLGKALTVMDGPYISIMPYGFSGLHSLTSVVYTHLNNFSQSNQENFNLANRNSNDYKMLKQLRNYINEDTIIYKHGSLKTIKTKLKSSHIDDSRPTNIYQLNKNPGYFQLFSGKISSIYEFENLW